MFSRSITTLLRSTWALAFALLVLLHAAGVHAAPPKTKAPARPALITPNGRSLPLRTVNGVKVGHLVAEEVRHEIAPGVNATVWGYNGSVPGPTIEAVAGDRLRIYVTNRLPAPTTVHWHGLVLPSGMDGVSGLSQKPIPPGDTFVYDFTLRHAGTFMYHPHHDEMTQMAMGMAGMFIVHPRNPRSGPKVDRDYVLMTQEWKIRVGASRPDPNEMSDFNVFTFNGKSFPQTEPLVARRGERIRIRIGNLSPTHHHPVHVHGLWFHVTATDGGFIRPSAQIPETTVLVPVGTTRVIEMVATESGDWAVHCHMTHHTMTQMGHGTTPLLGANPRAAGANLGKVVPGAMIMGTTGMSEMSEMRMPVPANSAPMASGHGPHGTIDMGGMFTVLKVREPGQSWNAWYPSPRGTTAGRATPAKMSADGIVLPANQPKVIPPKPPVPAKPKHAQAPHAGHGESKASGLHSKHGHTEPKRAPRGRRSPGRQP